jgi:uncharacterized membrane protein YoaK (UPF0700 family)
MPYSERDRIRESATAEPLILVGGAVLAFIAGFVNTVSLGYFHIPVSHMTGAVTRLSIDTASLNFREFLNIAYILSGFLAGASASGVIIGAGNSRPTWQYVLILTLESVALLVSYFLFHYTANMGLFFAALACGLQNAMASTYLGLIIRTTHMTGIVTDLGILIGHAVRHRTLRLWKISFLLLVLCGFFAGGITAFLSFRPLGFAAILIPAALCLLSAAGYYAARVRSGPAVG